LIRQIDNATAIISAVPQLVSIHLHLDLNGSSSMQPKLRQTC
jgi:hypothetical protein